MTTHHNTTSRTVPLPPSATTTLVPPSSTATSQDQDASWKKQLRLPRKRRTPSAAPCLNNHAQPATTRTTTPNTSIVDSSNRHLPTMEGVATSNINVTKQGLDDDDVIYNAVRHVPLPVWMISQASDTRDQKVAAVSDTSNKHNQDDSSATTILWPCLVFSEFFQSIALHGILYPNQKKLNNNLLRTMYVKDLVVPPGIDPVAQHEENAVAPFKVVLPLRDSQGCHKPLFDVDSSGALDAKNFRHRYKKDLNSSQCQNPGLHAALREVRRLICLDFDYGDEGNVSIQSPRKRPHTEQETQCLSRQFPKKRLSFKTISMATGGSTNIQTLNKVATTTGTTTVAPLVAAAAAQKPTANAMTTATTCESNANTASQATEETIVNRSGDGATSSATTASASRSNNSPGATEGDACNATSDSTLARQPQARKSSCDCAGHQSKKKKRASKTHKFAKKKPPTRRVKQSTGTLTAETRSKGKTSGLSAKKVQKQKTETILSIPIWNDVKPLLEVLGFVIDEKDQLFCRPNGDPRHHSNVQEGIHYFKSIQSFREYLCANGVDCDSQMPFEKQQDVDTISDWVDHAIVTEIRTAPRNQRKFKYAEKSPKAAWDLFQEYGVVQRQNYYWALPWVTPNAIVGPEKVIWEHLGKYGLPEELKNKIEVDELSALEYCLLNKTRKDKHASYIQKRTKRRQSREELQRKSLCTPAANKDALQECTQGPFSRNNRAGGNLPKPRKLLSENDRENDIGKMEEEISRPLFIAPDVPGNYNKEGNGGEVVQTAKKLPIAENVAPGVCPVESSTSEVPDCNEQDTNVLSSGLTTGIEVADDCNSLRPTGDPESIEENVDLPGTTIGEKLEACLKVLSKKGPESMVVTGHLTKSHDEIRKFLRAVIQTKGRSGGRNNAHAPIMYICGKPGTGKTLSTRMLCDEAIAEHTAALEKWEKPPQVRYLNCTALQNHSKKEALEKIMGATKLKSIARPNDDNDAFALILILDEVDTLVKVSDDNNIVKTLSNMAQDQNNVLSLIGISNAVNNVKTRRLLEYGMGGQKIVFNAYRKDELVNITKSKLGTKVVDQKAMEFVARKVDASSGDARQYLELITLAMNWSLKSMSTEERNAPLTKPVVTIKEAMVAIRATLVKYKDIISGLTKIEKVVLCAGVHLARKYDGQDFTMKLLKELTMEVYGVDNDLELEEFKGVMERLQDNGLLLLSEEDKRKLKQGMSMQELNRLPIRFELQLEDVESAVEETLMTEGFYRRLVERVKLISR